LHNEQVTRLEAHMADFSGAPAVLERWLWRNAAEGLGL